ncbi:hypothetical protein [Arthrobacter sp. A2-55]|uniref:hypothetical protein n=1 Tax=Arthrobacter sp. A2-55 TaxID=2897337 RepID=UPI0021CD22AE|nr:hypothetical protein [Arthrobacter sp. A2-55]MCU6481926.1 hypothetical protein [Arthrobacter sp. A2-55]
MTIPASVIHAAEKAVAAAQNVPFVGGRQRNIAGAVLAAVASDFQVESLRSGFKWLAGAVAESASKIPPSPAEPNLATSYWNGYRAAIQEVVDLLAEPKLIDKAMASLDRCQGKDS